MGNSDRPNVWDRWAAKHQEEMEKSNDPRNWELNKARGRDAVIVVLACGLISIILAAAGTARLSVLLIPAAIALVLGLDARRRRNG